MAKASATRPKAAKKAAVKKAAAPAPAPKKVAAKKAAAPAPKKAAAAPAPKAAAKKVAAKKVAAKAPKKVSAGLAKPLTPSAELAEIVGKKQLARTEIIKKIWDYIKAKGLQDSTNKRMINADDKLKAVFGGKTQVSMFELAKVVSAHVS